MNDNRTEIFKFLLQQAVKVPVDDGKSIYATDSSDVLCSLADADLSNLVPCSDEEADTHLFLHAVDAIRKGCRKCVYTDVVVRISNFYL